MSIRMSSSRLWPMSNRLSTPQRTPRSSLSTTSSRERILVVGDTSRRLLFSSPVLGVTVVTNTSAIVFIALAACLFPSPLCCSVDWIVQWIYRTLDSALDWDLAGSRAVVSPRGSRCRTCTIGAHRGFAGGCASPEDAMEPGDGMSRSFPRTWSHGRQKLPKGKMPKSEKILKPFAQTKYHVVI